MEEEKQKQESTHTQKKKLQENRLALPLLEKKGKFSCSIINSKDTLANQRMCIDNASHYALSHPMGLLRRKVLLCLRRGDVGNAGQNSMENGLHYFHCWKDYYYLLIITQYSISKAFC